MNYAAFVESWASGAEEGKVMELAHRCAWINLRNPLYVNYHDREWGRRPKTDQAHYELFILETFQAGLS